MSFVIGIDPGLKGAVAVLNREMTQVLDIYDFKLKPRTQSAKAGSKEICTKDLKAFLEKYAVPGTMAYLETAIVKPPMTLTAAFSIGFNFANVRGALRDLQIGFIELAPATWKKSLSLSADKNASMSRVECIHPREMHLIQRHDQAEAVLIAHAGVKGLKL